MLAPWKKSYDQPRQHIKKQRHYFPNKGLYRLNHRRSIQPQKSLNLWFSVVMYGCELDHKENWALKNWYFWAVVLEKTLERTLDCKELKPVNCKRNQPWICFRRTDAEAPILWPSDPKSQLIGKDPDDEKDWEQEEKGLQRMRWLYGITNSLDMSLSKLWRTGKLGVPQSMGVSKSRTLSNWTTIKMRTIISVPSGLFWGFN